MLGRCLSHIHSPALALVGAGDIAQLGKQEQRQSRAGLGSTRMGSQEGDDFSAAFPMSQSTDSDETCKHLQLQKELQFHPQCQ